MSPVIENLLWSWCGPFRLPLNWNQLQAMTGLSSDIIAEQVRSADVDAVWHENREHYRPSAECLRKTSGMVLTPFEEEREPENLVRVNLRRAI